MRFWRGLGLAAMAAGAGWAQEGEAHVGLLNPAAVAYARSSGKVFTVDTDGNAVVMTDGSGERKIGVGKGPVALAVDDARGLVWVANAGDGRLSIVDAKNGVVIGMVDVGRNPYSVAVNAAVGKVYVTHTFNDSLTIVDEESRAVRQVKGLGADLLAVNEKAGRMYLLGYEGGDLKVLDVEGKLLAKASPGMHAWGMVIDQATGMVFVARTGSAEVVQFDADGKLVRRIAVGQIPSALAVDEKAGRVYVANYGDDSMSVIDEKRGAAIATIKVGHRPEGIAVDASRGMAAVANMQDGTASIIDGRALRVVETSKAGRYPHAVVFDGLGQAHVANVEREAATVAGGKAR